MKWTRDNIPDQTGRIAIVTGANTGIGYSTAEALAQRGATVIVASRSLDKAKDAIERIRDSFGPAATPAGAPEVIKLDLNDLDSVREFAASFREKHDRLDLLINNAGVMIPPYGKTAQGFETQFGVNHLGHFALTGLLIDLLMETPDSRVVTVSSMAHRYGTGTINFDDLNWERKYKPWSAYGQSKLANLLFAFELQRKLETAGSSTQSLAAHPGSTSTDLQRHSSFADFFVRMYSMKPAKGALPTLRAATDLNAKGGEYYGPRGFMEATGYPKRVGSSKSSKDEELARRLWEVSEDLTGVSYLG